MAPPSSRTSSPLTVPTAISDETSSRQAETQRSPASAERTSVDASDKCITNSTCPPPNGTTTPVLDTPPTCPTAPSPALQNTNDPLMPFPSPLPSPYPAIRLIVSVHATQTTSTDQPMPGAGDFSQSFNISAGPGARAQVRGQGGGDYSTGGAAVVSAAAVAAAGGGGGPAVNVISARRRSRTSPVVGGTERLRLPRRRANSV